MSAMDEPLPLRNILKGSSEEEILYWGSSIKRMLPRQDANFVGQIMLDRAFLLGRVKIIAEALESQSNPPDEVARWAREGFDLVRTWED